MHQEPQILDYFQFLCNDFVSLKFIKKSHGLEFFCFSFIFVPNEKIIFDDVYFLLKNLEISSSIDLQFKILAFSGDVSKNVIL